MNEIIQPGIIVKGNTTSVSYSVEFLKKYTEMLNQLAGHMDQQATAGFNDLCKALGAISFTSRLTRMFLPDDVKQEWSRVVQDRAFAVGDQPETTTKLNILVELSKKTLGFLRTSDSKLKRLSGKISKGPEDDFDAVKEVGRVANWCLHFNRQQVEMRKLRMAGYRILRGKYFVDPSWDPTWGTTIEPQACEVKDVLRNLLYDTILAIYGHRDSLWVTIDILSKSMDRRTFSRDMHEAWKEMKKDALHLYGPAPSSDPMALSYQLRDQEGMFKLARMIRDIYNNGDIEKGAFEACVAFWGSMKDGNNMWGLYSTVIKFWCEGFQNEEYALGHFYEDSSPYSFISLGGAQVMWEMVQKHFKSTPPNFIESQPGAFVTCLEWGQWRKDVLRQL